MNRIFFLLILNFTISVIAQDGSDIKYLKTTEINNSLIGKMVHLDFYNRSFGGSLSENNERNDKVVIEIENEKIEFLEHRFDNGYNNWFSEQYLESTEYINGDKIRITMCKVKEVKSESIKVVLLLEYKDKNGNLNTDKSEKIEYEFPKRILSEILVQN